AGVGKIHVAAQEVRSLELVPGPGRGRNSVEQAERGALPRELARYGGAEGAEGAGDQDGTCHRPAQHHCAEAAAVSASRTPRMPHLMRACSGVSSKTSSQRRL